MTTTEVVAEVEDYNMLSSFIKIAGARAADRRAVAVDKKPSASVGAGP